MEALNIFKNLSPLDHRYFLANRKLFEKLQLYLSEEAAIRYSIRAESALLKTHISYHLGNDPALVKEAENLVDIIDPGEVYAEEEITQHNIRALVNVIKKKVSADLSPFVHLGATSVDILDTAFSMRVRDASRMVLLPLLIELENKLIDITLNEAETAQVGRTHGQHAVPITFGFTTAEYVARLGKSILKIENLSLQLKGKLAGAVGAYNASSMIVKDPEEMEKLYLSFLDLEPSEYSTQMVEPEYLLRLLLEINTSFGILANLADDLRNLQRSEIAEVKESFKSTQVGSSTMPQKRNPWNSEHVKSLWKTFAPRVITFYMDQISDHQRDLTNSASQRFVIDYLAGFAAAANRMLKVVSSLHVDREKLKSNLEMAGDIVLAEPAYILLALGGQTEAHEVIKQVTLSCENDGIAFAAALKQHSEAWNIIAEELKEKTGLDADQFFSDPSLYRGKAAERALAVAGTYMLEMKRMGGKIHGTDGNDEL